MPTNVIEAAGTTARIFSYLAPSGTGFFLTALDLAGTVDAVGVFDSINLSPDVEFNRGVLLTSGTGTPSRTNSSMSATVINGLEGNEDLNTFALSAFANAGITQDATVLTLTFNITDANINTLSFDIAFGSEEYPEFSSSDFVDIGAVWTGTGESAFNYALINGDPATPLAVIDANLNLGNFIDNQDGSLAIEYDGLVNRQTILVPVVQGINTIRVGVADTGDGAYDSGLFLFGITSSGSDVGGTFQETPVSAGDNFDAGDANVIFTGNANAFNGTSISNFSDLDQIFINGSFFSDLNALLDVGSLDIKLDTDGNGKFDTTITLEDPVLNATLNISPGPDGTALTLTALAPATGGDDNISGSDGLDYIGGEGGNDILAGLGGSDALSGGEGSDRLSGGAGADALVGGSGSDWLEGGSGNDVLTGGTGTDAFFFATAGNSGKDQINDFGNGDLLVTTSRIFDSNNDGIITFGSNKLLDLLGGGTVDIKSDAGKSIQKLEYDGSYTDEGFQYFVYSTVGSAVGVQTLTDSSALAFA